MPDELQTVVSVLANGWNLSPETVHDAMRRNESVRKRIERIAEGNGSGVDLHGLHIDVKLVLIGEPVGVI